MRRVRALRLEHHARVHHGPRGHGFTFEPSIGEFLLSHRDIRTPARGRIYSVNEGNYSNWSDGIKRYVDWLKTRTATSDRPTASRYVGSLVADFHRNLLYGGIYMYPADREHQSGKLRAALRGRAARVRGGTGGRRRKRRSPPHHGSRARSLHQRTPLFLGSPENVAECEAFIQEKHAAVVADRRG